MVVPGWVERLVRVPHVDTEEERVEIVIGFQPIDGRLSDSSYRVLTLVAQVPLIAQVQLCAFHAAQLVALGWQRCQKIRVGNVGVGVLSTHPPPRVEPPSIVEVMVSQLRRIVDQHRCAAVLREHLGQRYVLGRKGLPSANRKAKSTRVDIPTIGDCRIGRDVRLLEYRRIGSKFIEVGRSDPGIAVTPQVVSPERVVNQQDDVHFHVLPRQEVKIPQNPFRRRV